MALVVFGLSVVSLVRTTSAVADCPRYDTDTALRYDRSADGSIGTFSGEFAAADRAARPADYCAEIDYRPTPGVQGRARRVETPSQTSRSVSLAANDLINPDVDVALAAVTRQDAAGVRQTEVSQRVAATNAEQQVRWIHGEAHDRLIVAVAGSTPGAIGQPIAARGRIEMQRGDTLPAVAVSNVQTEIAFDVSGVAVVAGRSGTPQVGRQGTWSLALGNLFRLSGLQLRRAAVSLARLGGRNERVATSVDATVLGSRVRFEGQSARSRDWSAGVDWLLVDVAAGELRFDVDLKRADTGVERELMLSGQFAW